MSFIYSSLKNSELVRRSDEPGAREELAERMILLIETEDQAQYALNDATRDEYCAAFHLEKESLDRFEELRLYVQDLVKDIEKGEFNTIDEIAEDINEHDHLFMYE